ncbi:hypothetical protein MB84_09990 [Pandoraea oxalativorans]|uniref:Uncharacterized protein n=1 Tax=Pandoraea oxalativorans TaxID=573737 RepID=A0A0E3YB27_9BURK|nr:hypothetical protein MB84_09990 [Pandoraea oxalativorans]
MATKGALPVAGQRAPFIHTGQVVTDASAAADATGEIMPATPKPVFIMPPAPPCTGHVIHLLPSRHPRAHLSII